MLGLLGLLGVAVVHAQDLIQVTSSARELGSNGRCRDWNQAYERNQGALLLKILQERRETNEQLNDYLELDLEKVYTRRLKAAKDHAVIYMREERFLIKEARQRFFGNATARQMVMAERS